ncbi:MAG: C-GCAxxG-C-C family protein [Desulfobacterales bacterium]|nr:C-GCAxxG-C-C family protein [Desulfobacterales bacterium]
MNFDDKYRFQCMEYLVRLIGEKTQNLFVTKQLMCSEAVLTVLNRSLEGGLEPEMAIRLASGFPEGIGGGGCTCGALTGGIISLGLFLGREKTGILNSKKITSLSKELHDRFKNQFGATCCRILSKNLKYGSKKQFERCSAIVAFSSEHTACIILRKNPNLISIADCSYLEQLDSNIKSKLIKITNSIL